MTESTGDSLDELLEDVYYYHSHPCAYDFPGLVVRMSESDLENFSAQAMEMHPIPNTIPDGSMMSSIYGIPIEIDDSLKKPEITYR